MYIKPPTRMPCNTINEVIDRLTEIVEDCKKNGNTAGYFAALYRKVTIRVRDGIAKNEFEDNARMERLDVLFANRYLAAYDSFYKSGETTQSWKLAFIACGKKNSLILQQMLLGINAHINLDLGIAAVETVGKDRLALLESDFNAINNILSELVDDVQDKIGEISPLFGLLDPLTGRLDEELTNFSIGLARDGAWKFANELYVARKNKIEETIANRDYRIGIFASGLANPKNKWLKTVLRIIHWFENRDVANNIEVLAKA